MAMRELRVKNVGKHQDLTSHWCGLISLSVLLVLGWWQGQLTVAIGQGIAATATLRSQLPLADPIIESDIELTANRTTQWTVGQTRYLLLEHDVVVAMGSYGFKARRAVIQIDIEKSSDRRIYHLCAYLDQAKPLRGRGPTQVQASRLLVTASTTGHLSLNTDLIKNQSTVSDPLVDAAVTRIAHYIKAISQTPTTSANGLNELEVTTLTQRDAKQQQMRLFAKKEPVSADASPSTHTTKLSSSATSAQGSSASTLEGWPTNKGNTKGSVKSNTKTQTTPTNAATSSNIKPTANKASTNAAAESASRFANTTTQATSKSGQGGALILPSKGFVTLTFDRMVVKNMRGKGEAVAMLFGNVGLMFVEASGQRQMSLTARNAVVFIDQTKSPEGVFTRIQSDAVTGVYLEDNVIASDGDYTVRAPRVYYDPPRNKAIVLDAVMHTWYAKRNVPIYLRAKQLVQENRATWHAKQAQLTTSEFNQPHFAIAARQITLKEKPRQGGSDYRFVAKQATLRAGKVPFFYWPKLTGKAGEIPLKSIQIGNSTSNGPKIETRWDLFALAGREKPEGVSLNGNLDIRGDRGLAVGADLKYKFDDMFGRAEAYLVARDEGEDHVGGRVDIGHDGDTRGFLNWQHRQYLENDWELSIELSNVSDENFLESFFPEKATNEKQYETSIYLKQQSDDQAFTFFMRYDLQDFVTQTTTLQSRRATTDKLPELSFYKVGKNFWGNRLTYFGENHLGLIRLRYDQKAPATRGFNNLQSWLLFGMPNTTSFENAGLAGNMPTNHVLRFDSRHEVQAPLKINNIDVVPYAVARVTAYDDDFNTLSGQNDQVRLWGEMGLKLHTQFHRNFDQVNSRLFNLHRMRHVIEPTVEMSFAGTNVESGKLPVFDPDVESLRQGLLVRLGLRNTLQTQRGGPGRWRSVDWLVLDTDIVLSDGDSNALGGLPQAFSTRPEFSRGRDHFYTRIMWMISDTLATIAEYTYDFDLNTTRQWRAGLVINHSPKLKSFIDIVEIDSLGFNFPTLLGNLGSYDDRLVRYGVDYALTSKYNINFELTHDLDLGKSREVKLTFVRKLPHWRLVTFFSHNSIDSNTTFGMVLIPLGLGGSRYSRIKNDRLWN